jgi:UDP-GlcNAc:undecaprenyl-phosphate GlcNAc-1-phosphate transferase
MAAVYAFVLALFVSMSLVPPLESVAERVGLTDAPGGRKVHQKVIPRTGGIAIFIGFLAPVLVWLPMREDLRAVLIGASVLFFFGLLDDRFNLDYRAKLLGQVLASIIVTAGGGIVIRHFPFVPGGTLSPSVGIPLTVFVLTGVTNAVNLSDGLDGLAGGISLLVMTAVALLARQAGDAPLAMITMAVCGATLGFLRFNTHPARVFMGDSGSQFLGFSAGVLAVAVDQISNPAMSPLVPLLLLGLPILDTLTVMITRIRQGRSPFSPDRNHIHHRLLDLGLHHYEAVAAVYCAQALLVILAYALRYSSDLAILAVYGVFAAALLLGLRSLTKVSAYLGARSASDSPIGRLLNRAREKGMLRSYAFTTLEAVVPLFLIAGALVSRPVATQTAVQAAVLLLLFLLALMVRRSPSDFVERLIAYATAVSIAYLVETTHGVTSACGRCIHVLFAVPAIAVAVWARFSGSAFKVSTLDLLIVFAAVALPNIPGSIFQEFGVVGLESIILLYAIEIILLERERRFDPLHLSVLGALAIVAVKGFLAALS